MDPSIHLATLTGLLLEPLFRKLPLLSQQCNLPFYVCLLMLKVCNSTVQIQCSATRIEHNAISTAVGYMGLLILRAKYSHPVQHALGIRVESVSNAFLHSGFLSKMQRAAVERMWVSV